MRHIFASFDLLAGGLCLRVIPSASGWGLHTFRMRCMGVGVLRGGIGGGVREARRHPEMLEASLWECISSGVRKKRTYFRKVWRRRWAGRRKHPHAPTPVIVRELKHRGQFS